MTRRNTTYWSNLRRRPVGRRDGGWNRASLFLFLALLMHVVMGQLATELIPWWMPEIDMSAPPHTLVILQPPPTVEDEEEPEREEFDGQLVEVAPPDEQHQPEDPEYLSEFDITVEEETRSDKFEINPEVVAAEHSDESKYEVGDYVDMNTTKPSTGATVGNDRFEPERDGSLASLPSPWRLTNKVGPQDPVPTSHAATALSGAPQNDLLDEERGDVVALNTKEYLYHSYLMRIRRLVNFYWKQNLDNAPSSMHLTKSSYRTGVGTILNADGALEFVEVTEDSGNDVLDDCVVRAFRMAGPFPNPPQGLIEKDGRVYLPDMGFTVQFGTARARFTGVDPRSGVQFPGLLKSPR